MSVFASSSVIHFQSKSLLSILAVSAGPGQHLMPARFKPHPENVICSQVFAAAHCRHEARWMQRTTQRLLVCQVPCSHARPAHPVPHAHPSAAAHSSWRHQQHPEYISIGCAVWKSCPKDCASSHCLNIAEQAQDRDRQKKQQSQVPTYLR
jgi:hypothetical protein